jgi:cytosine/adenosine deaminase-related metal-dependent hydrolase
MSGPTVVQARWVLPIDRPPIARGWIEVADGHISRIGQGVPPDGTRDLGNVALMPGLVNTHAHLELSWLAGRIPPADSFVQWVRSVVRTRAGVHPHDPRVSQGMQRAARQMRETGTVLVGDISNTLVSGAALREAGLGGVIFHELLGFNAAHPETLVRDAWVQAESACVPASSARAEAPLAMSVVAHAPYSVSPGLFRQIAAERRETPLSVHLAESVEELELLRTGAGPFKRLLEDLGVWTDAWEPPQSDPVSYLDDVGYLQPGMLAVHAVHLLDRELEHLRAAGAVVVTCPRSNLWVGAGMPRVSRFYATGVPVAIGTDSLASAPSVNLFDELAELRRIAPDVTAASLLESATRVGAEALGFGRRYGTLAPGKRAALIAVDVPADLADVEEYLVSGVPADAVRRLTP